MDYPILKTVRLRLLPCRAGAAQDVASALLRNQRRFSLSFSRVLKEVREDRFVLRSEVGFCQGDLFRFAVYQEQVLIGMVGLKEVCSTSKQAEILYLVLPEFEGHGFAYEATEALIEWAARIGLSRLTLRTVVQNKRSLALASRLGFEEARLLFNDHLGPDGRAHHVQEFTLMLAQRLLT